MRPKDSIFRRWWRRTFTYYEWADCTECDATGVICGALCHLCVGQGGWLFYALLRPIPPYESATAFYYVR